MVCRACPTAWRPRQGGEQMHAAARELISRGPPLHVLLRGSSARVVVAPSARSNSSMFVYFPCFFLSARIVCARRNTVNDSGDIPGKIMTVSENISSPGILLFSEAAIPGGTNIKLMVDLRSPSSWGNTHLSAGGRVLRLERRGSVVLQWQSVARRDPFHPPLSCLSWKWRERSFVKITERTYEKRAQSLHPRRESSHLEATPLRPGPGFRTV